MSCLKVRRFNSNNDLKLQSDYLTVEDYQPGDIALSEVRKALETGGITDFVFLDRKLEVESDKTYLLHCYWYKDGITNYLNIHNELTKESSNAITSKPFKRK